VLFDKISSVCFILKIYLYFSIGNGQRRQPALCQLYRRTFVPYSDRRSDAEQLRGVGGGGGGLVDVGGRRREVVAATGVVGIVRLRGGDRARGHGHCGAARTGRGRRRVRRAVAAPSPAEKPRQ